MIGGPTSQVRDRKPAAPQAAVGSQVHLRIERLVMDGLPFAGGDLALFQATIETELGRLLRDSRFSFGSVHSAALHSLPTAQSVLTESTDARLAGCQVASTLYEALDGGVFKGGAQPNPTRPQPESHRLPG